MRANQAERAVSRAAVLVVEDDNDSREALMGVLGVLGHRVYGAATGVRALEMALRLRPEVVVTDLLLPEIDGSDLARQLRMRSGGYDPVVIAFSGAHLEAARARESGCDGFVLKPEVDELLGMLTDASLNALRARRVRP
jgi:CheY-like chemotaxis protein